MQSEHVTIEGHIIDSLILPKVIDEVVSLGGAYEIVEVRVGARREDPSFARIKVSAETQEDLAKVLDEIRQHGANPDTVEDARLLEADTDGALPPGFYSSTNLETEIRVNGRWLHVERPEMDCGIVVEGESARTIPMGEVKQGMRIVMSGLGIRALPVLQPGTGDKQDLPRRSSDLSSEKPNGLLVDQVAGQILAIKDQNKTIL